MKKQTRLIFWQNTPSIHQAPLLRRLSQYKEYNIVLVSQEPILSERKAMGWTFPNYGETKVYISPDQDTVVKLLKHETAETIHIVTGFRAYPLMKKVLNYCIKNNLNVGVFAEAPNTPYGTIGLVKKVIYSIIALKIKNKIQFVLAIGDIGVNWYSQCGFPDNKTFQYAYFVKDDKKYINTSTSSSFEIIFVGGLIPRKGVDLLLKALASVKTSISWKLQILGDGFLSDDLKILSKRLNLDNKVTFLGSKSNDETLQYIAESDLLVLPSREDGWGAVVSEALLQGVPVICSDRCGASVLIADKSRGMVFHSESVNELTNALNETISKGRLNSEEKKLLLTWSKKTLSAATGACYLDAILRHVYQSEERPAVPWL